MNESPSLGGRLVGVFPFFNAERFQKINPPNGASWHVHKTGESHESFRLEWFFSGDASRAMATLVSSDDPHSPYCKATAPFLQRVFTCGGTIRTPGTPYKFQFSLGQSQLGNDFSVLARTLLDQTVELPLPPKEVFRVGGEISFDDSHGTVIYVTLSHNPFAVTAAYRISLTGTVISHNVAALEEALIKFIVLLQPCYAKRVLQDTSWGLLELSNLLWDWYPSPRFSYPFQIEVRDNGFSIPVTPRPFWLQVPSTNIAGSSAPSKQVSLRFESDQRSVTADNHPNPASPEALELAKQIQERRFYIRCADLIGDHNGLFAQWA